MTTTDKAPRRRTITEHRPMGHAMTLAQSVIYAGKEYRHHDTRTEPCGCVLRWWRHDGWERIESCGAHPIEPYDPPPDRPTPEERAMSREWGSRSARLP